MLGKPRKVSLQLWIVPELRRMLKKQAKIWDRSQAETVRIIIEKHFSMDRVADRFDVKRVPARGEDDE